MGTEEAGIATQLAILVVEVETPTPHWEVRREGSLAPISLHKILEEALQRANVLAAKLGLDVIVRRREGEATMA